MSTGSIPRSDSRNDQASKLRELVEPRFDRSTALSLGIEIATIAISDSAWLEESLHRDLREAWPYDLIELSRWEIRNREREQENKYENALAHESSPARPLLIAFRPEPWVLLEVYRAIKRFHRRTRGASIGLMVDGVTEFGQGDLLAQQIGKIAAEHLHQATSYLGEIAECEIPRVRVRVRGEAPSTFLDAGGRMRQRDFAGDRRKRIKSWLEQLCPTGKLVAVS